MATSIRQFNVDLYREHLEDASFLFEQRLAYLHDPEVDWPDLGDWERRFEAHIDALVVGGELALEVCRQQALEGDPGVMHAALRVFCLQDRKEDAITVLRALDPADESAARAAAQGLRYSLPKGWQEDLLRSFQDDHRFAPVLARVIGYRRSADEEALRHGLAQKPSLGNAELAWALGRVGSSGSVPLLWPLLNSDDARVSEAAAIALMRLGEDRMLPQLTQMAGSHSWARRALGIGGGSKSVPVLREMLAGPNADVDAVIALGLLGDLSAVVPLVSLLSDEKLAESAAVALNTITGAQLYARVFVPDQFDPEELSDEERDAFEKDGTVPTRNGEPYGNWERRPLVDQARWRAWLDENKHRFTRQLRWRMGRPHGPAALLECLVCETSPYAVRCATYEELVVRFRLDVPFEVDLTVTQQRRFLDKIGDWVARQSGTFEEGRWYFAGQLQN